MPENKKYVIVGGGIAGLYAALVLLKKNAGKDIMILDREKEPGGLLRSMTYNPYGCFDIGTHIPAETGNPEVDEILAPFYNTEIWNKMTGPAKDMPGCFYKSRFNQKNQYINLDVFDKETRVQYLADIKAKLNEKEKSNYITAYDVYDEKYGKSYIEEIIEPIFNKTFGKSSKDMTPQSAIFLPLGRVIDSEFFDTKQLLQDERLRKVIAFPEQKTVPEEFVSKTNSFYPKKRGIDTLVKSIIEYLVMQGVRVETEAEIGEINSTENNVKNIVYSKKGINYELKVENVIWSAGIISLAKLMGVPVNFAAMDKPKTTIVANIIFKRDPGIGESHYSYILDTNFCAYRLTNYKSFCKDDMNKEYFPVTMEFLSEDVKESFSEIVVKEIVEIGLAKDASEFEILGIEVLSNGFPVLSVKNDTQMESVRIGIKEKNLKNLKSIGIASEKNLFFYRDILKDVMNKLN